MAAAKLEGSQDPNDWVKHARPEQIPPDGNWHIWLVVAGRGWGKTRCGAETLAKWASSIKGTYAVVGPTFGDARAICVEGAGSGLISVLQSHNVEHTYNRSLYEIRLGNGSLIVIVGADTPDRLRGYNLSGVWADEIASWRRPATWYEALMPALRIGKHPRAIATGTPKPVPLVKDLMGREDGSVTVTRGRTMDNAANLSKAALDELVARYQGTRLGRQELDGELLEDVEGALWTLASIELARVVERPEHLTHVCVSVDPAGDGGEGHDEHGITVSGVTGRAAAAEFYVLADLSRNCTPSQAARTAILAYVEHEADCIVYEKNQGQGWITAVLNATWLEMAAAGEVTGVMPPLRAVNAARSKRLRAEPVQALYEQCVSQGTKILTKRGQVSVEGLSADDYVWTRRGWKRVLWSGQTLSKPTVRLSVDGRTLTCSEDHPVYVVGRGFVPASTVDPLHGDRLLVWHAQTAERPANRSDGVEVAPRSSGGRPENLSGLIKSSKVFATTSHLMATTALAGTAAVNSCTEQSGVPTMASYPPKCTFTTEITTQQITRSVTSLPSRLTGMLFSTTQPDLPSTYQTRNSPINEVLLPSGLHAVGLPYGVSATGAETSSVLLGLGRGFAIPDATPATGTLRASRVESVSPSGIRPLWNLMVEDEPEFLADGILTHNCRVHHVGIFAVLESQQTTWIPGDSDSPDRLDSLVHGITWLYDHARHVTSIRRPPQQVALPSGVGAAMGGQTFGNRYR